MLLDQQSKGVLGRTSTERRPPQSPIDHGEQALGAFIGVGDFTGGQPGEQVQALGVVDVLWSGAGWEIGASSIARNRPWPPGRQVITR